jgi:hypothetical protein
MKTLNRNLKRLTFAVAAGLTLAVAHSALAQFASPVGTWDFVVNGRENGVAYVTFNSDFTLSGYEVLTPKRLTPAPDDDERGGDIGRTGVEASVTEDGLTNFTGFALISGYWTHDITGRKILGFYTEGNFSELCTTNVEVTESTTTEIIDNGDGTYTTNLTTFFVTNEVRSCETEGLTNGLSFTAIVRPGTRLSLKADSINGKKNLRGVPATAIADLSGEYYGVGKRAGVSFTEFLTLSPSGSYANTFDVTGAGAGYDIEGYYAVASRQKKLGLVYRGSREDDPLVSLFGSIN